MPTNVLLTNVVAPLPTWGWNDSLTDGTNQRFTKGQDIFTLSGHMHCHAVHILAQNISARTRVLEFPRWDDFEEELKKGYDYVGISYFTNHTGTVEEMCKLVKKISPKSKVILGSLGTLGVDMMFPNDELMKYVDYVCHGEGVSFMRELLGDDVNAPITQRLLPKCGMAPAWLDEHPRGISGMLVSGVGCPSGCDFCSTTTHYGNKRNEMATPRQLFEEMKRYRRVYPQVNSTQLLEEDHFKFPKHLSELGKLITEDEEIGIESLGFMTFGSIGSMDKWDPEDIAATGVNSVFVGVESKFAPQHGYHKREGDAKDVIDKLHGCGVSTIGAWMCGWDWHDHQTIYEDLNWFISMEPTMNQLSRVCPFPGTPIYDRLKEEGRVDESTSWEDTHFYGGGYQHTNFSANELMDIMKKGYERMYETWGPSVTRMFRVALNGYEFCRDAKNPILNKRVVNRHEAICKGLAAIQKTAHEFAPNREVQSKVDDLLARYKDLFGELNPMQKLAGEYITSLAAKEKKFLAENPEGRPPRQEPYKIYDYDGLPKKGDEVPYKHFTPHVSEDYKDYLKKKKAQQKFMKSFMPQTEEKGSKVGDKVEKRAKLPSDFLNSL